jgi:hypothetical protein
MFELLIEKKSMSQIFSVEIEYSAYKHTALVSVCALNEEPVYHVQLMDNFLKEIFQTEHIRYQGNDGYQYCDMYDDELAEIMIERIANAIQKKLYGDAAIIRRLFFYK